MVQERPELRKVDLAIAQRYASSINAVVVEASAKTGENVTEMFNQAIDRPTFRLIAAIAEPSSGQWAVG
jgi:hypothetical protein